MTRRCRATTFTFVVAGALAIAACSTVDGGGATVCACFHQVDGALRNVYPICTEILVIQNRVEFPCPRYISLELLRRATRSI